MRSPATLSATSLGEIGHGIDTLSGGLNSDIVVFDTLPNATADRDAITDFGHVEDGVPAKPRSSCECIEVVGGGGNNFVHEVEELDTPPPLLDGRS